MAKVQKHPEFAGVTSETHPNLIAADGSWETPATKPKAFYSNGKPRKYISAEDRAARLAAAGPRRSDAESLVFWQGKLAAAGERHAKELAGINKKIAYFSGERVKRNAVDPVAAQAAAQALAARGVTPDQFAEMAEQFRLAAAAVRGKSEAEVAALVAPPFTVTPPLPQLATV